MIIILFQILYHNRNTGGSLEKDEDTSTASDSIDQSTFNMTTVPAIRSDEDVQDYAADTETTSSSLFPQTQIVLRLNPYIQPAAVSWLVKKITGKKQDGGAELLVRCEPYGGRRKEVFQKQQ